MRLSESTDRGADIKGNVRTTRGIFHLRRAPGPATVAVLTPNHVDFAGPVRLADEAQWSNSHECAGMSADEQKKWRGLILDRVSTPSDPRARV